MTTGMMRPFCEAVFALKLLQKSMMLTPCWPRAGPTGGAGVALPAGICNFTCPITFFAIIHSLKLVLLHLQKIEFHWRCAPEDRDHDFQGAAIDVDVIDNAVKVRERPIDDPDRFAFFERQF